MDTFDDLLSYSRDMCSRSVLSLVSDKMEEENDAEGLRGFKVAMILYFLNRKQHVQDSKYAYSLLLDLVQEFKASERTKQRMDNLVCINVRGKPGEAIHRDKKCEHLVKEVKNALKGTHSSLKESYHHFSEFLIVYIGLQIYPKYTHTIKQVIFVLQFQFTPMFGIYVILKITVVKYKPICFAIPCFINQDF